MQIRAHYMFTDILLITVIFFKTIKLRLPHTQFAIASFVLTHI